MCPFFIVNNFVDRIPIYSVDDVYKRTILLDRALFSFEIFYIIVLEQVISATHITNTTKWKPNGVTIAGGNGQGNQSNQLYFPQGIYVDDDGQCIYIADHQNHRIVAWKYGAKTGEVVAGGNGRGNQMNQLDYPRDVIVDKKNDSLIICDRSNRRVVRWSRQNATKRQTIISNIDCYGLTMDNNG